MQAEIDKAINEYAKAYKKLQELQEEENSIIPKGDQKTGCIGEYYAYKFLKTKYPQAKIKFGGHSQKGWDIEVKPELHIQVKTVSDYSKTRTISPIHKGWDELYLIFLNKGLKPEGFWIMDYSDELFGGKKVLKGKKCPHPDKPNTGSSLPFGDNKIGEFLDKINKYKN